MKEGRKPEYPEKTHGDELQKNQISKRRIIINNAMPMSN